MRGWILVCMLWLAGGAALAQDRSVNLVTDVWPGVTAKDGSGAYLELMRAVFEPEYTVKVEFLAWSRAANVFRLGRYDGLVGESKFQAGMLKPKVLLDRDRLSGFYLKSAIPNWNEAQVLSTKRLAWTQGFGFEALFKTRPNYVEVKDAALGFKMLEAGRFDVLIDYASDFEENMAASKLDPAKFARADLELYENMYVAFHDTDQGRALAAYFDQRMRSLIAQGVPQRIFKKYGFTYPANP